MLRASLPPLSLLLAVPLAACTSVQGMGPHTTSKGTVGEWSRFRGPNGTGVSPAGRLPDRLDEEHTLWRTILPPGHSSPVLCDGKVFLTAFEGENLWTYALSAENGDVLWRQRAPRSRNDKIDGRNNAASPTPAVDGRCVCVFFADYGLLAYDHRGDELWRVPLGPFDNVYGMGASPVLVDDVCVLACDQNTNSFVLGVDRISGEVLWRTERPLATSGHCTPIVFTAEGGEPEVVLPGSFLLDAYSPRTGERRWWVNGLCFEMKSVPVLHGETIYINGYGSPMNDPGQMVEVGNFDDVVVEHDADGAGQIDRAEMPPGKLVPWFGFVDLDGSGNLAAKEWGYLKSALASRNGLLAIRAGGEGDMSDEGVLWSYHRSIPQLPSALVFDDVLYLLNDAGGLVTTLDPSSGEVLGRGRIEEAVDNYYASPVAGDDKVFLISEAGLAVVLPAGGSLEPLSITDLQERCYATPALAEGRVFLRTERALYCFANPKIDDRPGRVQKRNE